MTEKPSGGSGGGQGDRPIYLRQWIGRTVTVISAIQTKHVGVLCNIVFDEKRLMYIVLDDLSVLNFDHVVEVRLEK
jgi:RNase P/RNase MRP subunit p29